MITLALDASTYRGTVALFHGGRLLAQNEAAMRGREAERLMPAVDATLRQAALGVEQLERVVCGAGPGSFTSLRIAASIAKGLAVGRAIPLYAASSLALIVAANVDGDGTGQRYLAVLDALRGESYAAEFEHSGDAIRRSTEARLVPSGEVAALAQAGGVIPVGPTQAGAWLPHARGLAMLLDDIRRDGPVDVARWEPTYGRMAEAQARWEAAHGRPLTG